MLTVDLDKCIGCGECEDACSFGAIEVKDEKAVVDHDTCTMCGTCVDACPEGALELEKDETAPSGVDTSQWRGVWVTAEYRFSQTAPVTFELLGKGREIANDLDVPLTALLIGSGVKEHCQELIERGADRVIVVDHPELEQFRDDVYARIVSNLALKEKPEVILAGATAMGRSYIPQVATMLETGLTADCTELTVRREDRALLQTRPAFGGNLLATIVCPNHRPQMSTVRPHVLKALEPDSSRKGEIIEVTPTEEELKTRLVIVDSVMEKSEGPGLADSDIVVAAGRGMENEKNMELIHELAELLGAGVGASRAVTDAEWLPHRAQIGQTGVTVSPKLYMGFGISGAIQHVVGIQGADTIVAVNKDPEAPIFDLATYGIVGDAKTILKLLIKRIKKERGA